MRDVLAKMRECGKYAKMREFPHDFGTVDTYAIPKSQLDHGNEGKADVDHYQNEMISHTVGENNVSSNEPWSQLVLFNVIYIYVCFIVCTQYRNVSTIYTALIQLVVRDNVNLFLNTTLVHGIVSPFNYTRQVTRATHV